MYTDDLKTDENIVTSTDKSRFSSLRDQGREVVTNLQKTIQSRTESHRKEPQNTLHPAFDGLNLNTKQQFELFREYEPLSDEDAALTQSHRAIEDIITTLKGLDATDRQILGLTQQDIDHIDNSRFHILRQRNDSGVLSAAILHTGSDKALLLINDYTDKLDYPVVRKTMAHEIGHFFFTSPEEMRRIYITRKAAEAGDKVLIEGLLQTALHGGGMPGLFIGGLAGGLFVAGRGLRAISSYLSQREEYDSDRFADLLYPDPPLGAILYGHKYDEHYGEDAEPKRTWNRPLKRLGNTLAGNSHPLREDRAEKSIKRSTAHNQQALNKESNLSALTEQPEQEALR